MVHLIVNKEKNHREKKKKKLSSMTFKETEENTS